MAALDGIYGVHPTDADKITSAIDLFANNFSGKKEASEVHGGYLGPKCVV